ncbi:UNC93-like protein [Caerostris darwini]|uniref:UNC93-like protein n=1 Tax=Caerostris darwini TaxID=1538125 RepID=A0AAV4XAY8_9ARAC|nr:UNC93-like protein [Caerostris darwini]
MSCNSQCLIDEIPTKNCSVKRFTKLRIIKNEFVICAGVLLLFTAYDGLTMLQSTMNHEQGIGVASQALSYACFCISAVLFPKYAIKKLGSKGTFALSMLSYLPYVASNFYSHWILVVPTSIVIGMGASLLWGSQATYLTDIAHMYANIIFEENKSTSSLESSSPETNASNTSNLKMLMSRSLSCSSINFRSMYKNDANGVILKSYTDGTLKRNSVTVAVISKSPVDIYISDLNLVEDYPHTDYGSFKNIEQHNIINDYTKSLPSSMESSTDHMKSNDRTKFIESTTAIFFGFHGFAYLTCHIWSNLMTYFVLLSEAHREDVTNSSSCLCGADFCSTVSTCFEHNIEKPSDQIRFILTGICVCIGIASVLLVTFFLDPLETDKEEVSFSADLLMATYKIAKRKEILLLLPASFHIGMVQGFYTGDFTKAFIACAWGTYHVGLVTVLYGTVCGISSFCCGCLVKKIGRIPVFFAAYLVNVAACLFLLFWSPSAQEPNMFFAAAGMWGVYVGALWSQLRAFYGVLFKVDEEAAFAAFHVWYSLGFTLSFAYSNYFCTSVKIYVLITLCILGFTGYLIVELLHIKNKIKK